jgi:hypothetical protein
LLENYKIAEYLEWYVTGLFCAHIVRVFAHIGLEKIPSRYVLKRFTRYATEETSFDRHDMVYAGPGGDTKARRTKSILTDLFKLQRSAVMSEQAMEKAKAIITAAIEELDKIPTDLIVPSGPQSRERSYAGGASTSAAPDTGTIANTLGVAGQEETLVSPSAPPVSTTKGCRKNSTVADGVPEPHFQRGKEKKRRKCGNCGIYGTGHNSVTCERAQQQKGKPVVKRPRGRPKGTGGKYTVKKVLP